MKDNKVEVEVKKYGRKELLIVSLILLIISLAGLAGGIILIVNGVMSGEVAQIIWKIIVGVILVILGGSIGWVSILMLFTAKDMMKNEQGNLKDTTNSAIGTANINKCDNCGRELEEGIAFCTHCGREVNGQIKCDCGEINNQTAEYCAKCGKNLK